MTNEPNENPDDKTASETESNAGAKQPQAGRFGWRDLLSFVIAIPLAIVIAPLAIKHLEVERGWEIVSWCATIVLTWFAVSFIVAGKNGLAARIAQQDAKTTDDTEDGA